MPRMESHDDQQRLQVPHVLVKIATPERMRAAYLNDLLKGALFIKTGRPFAVDRQVDVDLLAPGRVSPIRVRCKVVQNNGQGMELKFVDLEPAMMVALDALLDEYQRDPATVVEQTVEPITDLHALGDLARGPTPSASVEISPAELLQLELESARVEIGELQTRLSEAMGDAEAYRHQLTLMEADVTEATAQLEAERGRRFEAERREAEVTAGQGHLTARVEEFEALLFAAREQLAAAVETTTQLEAARERIAVLERPAPKAPTASRAPAVAAAAAPADDQFLRRLRANEPLLRLARFHDFTPSNPDEGSVMGLLEGCDRYSDLIVLARSMATPAQLEKILVGFHRQTLIAFER